MAHLGASVESTRKLSRSERGDRNTTCSHDMHMIQPFFLLFGSKSKKLFAVNVSWSLVFAPSPCPTSDLKVAWPQTCGDLQQKPEVNKDNLINQEIPRNNNLPFHLRPRPGFSLDIPPEGNRSSANLSTIDWPEIDSQLHVASSWFIP
jgi:hypothetical protein